MSIGLQPGDEIDKQNRLQIKNFANGYSPVLGREFEIAEILAFLKQKRKLRIRFGLLPMSITVPRIPANLRKRSIV